MEISQEKSESFIPHSPVLPVEKSSSFQTALNLFKSSLGIGIFALPYCFTQSGIVLATIFLILTAALTVYTVFKIVELADLKGLTDTRFRELYIDYLGSQAVFLLELCIAINYFGVGITYVIFFIDFFENAFNTTGILYSLVYAGLSLVIIIPLSLIRGLEKFTKYSIIANILTILVLIVLFAEPMTHVNPENVQKYGDFIEVPGLLGVALYAFVSPGLVIPMRNSMKKKQDFKSTFLIVLIIVWAIYAGFSILCCYAFPNNQISQNMLKSFGHINHYFLALQGLYALALVITYPMQLNPLFEVLEHIPSIQDFLLRNQQRWLHKNSVRIGISLLIFPFGIFISNFADFVNLLGAICFFIIQFIYPLWAYNTCFGDRIGKLEKWGNWGLVLISFVGLVLASYNSIWSFMYR